WLPLQVQRKLWAPPAHRPVLALLQAQAAASTAGAGAWLWAVQEAAARRQYLPGADDPEPPVPTEDLSSDQVLATFGMAPSKRSGERRMDGPEGRSS
ncbi:unnamed protein product, partial [Effrenium voratum]